MNSNFTNIEKFLDFIQLDKNNRKKILKNPPFCFLIPQRLANKIKKNDPKDPIFLQFTPLVSETIQKKGFLKDPLLEKKYTSSQLIKKYNNRALLVCTNFCAMHCRFCFRKFLDKKNEIKDFTKSFEILKKDKSIEEIILSGGDPLALNNEKLAFLLNELAKIKHIKIIRFHTRYIIGYPERISSPFIEILKKIRKQIIFVFHINHPIEIDLDVIKAMNKLRKNGFLLFNQSTLLKGINDSFETLKELNYLLIKNGVIPYYLHKLDKILGSHSFEISKVMEKTLMKKLNENLSGYMCPKYVQEIPGIKRKVPIIL